MLEENEIIENEIEIPGSQSESDDLRATIKDAFKTVNESKEVSVEDKPATAARSRDETGKFAKTEVKTDKPDTTVAQKTQELKDVKREIKAPASWKSEARAKWETLPDDIRAEVARREEETHSIISRHDDDRAFAKQLKEVINPYMPLIQSEGGTPAGAVRDLLNTAYVLRTGSPQQKATLLRQVAQQYGVDLSQGAQTQQVPNDPIVQQLYQKVAQLEGTLTNAERAKQQQEQSAINQQIQAFASDPKNVHFEAVKPHMAALLQSGLAKDMEDAYEQAIYARPDIRSTFLEQRNAESETKRVAEAKVKADAARKAGSSVVGSPGVAVPNIGKTDRSLRDEIAANFKAVYHG